MVLLKGTTYPIAFSSSIKYSKQPIWSSIIGFGAYVLPYLTTSIPSATLVSDGFRASFVFRAYILDVARKAYKVLMVGMCQYITYNSILSYFFEAKNCLIAS